MGGCTAARLFPAHSSRAPISLLGRRFKSSYFRWRGLSTSPVTDRPQLDISRLGIGKWFRTKKLLVGVSSLSIVLRGVPATKGSSLRTVNSPETLDVTLDISASLVIQNLQTVLVSSHVHAVTEVLGNAQRRMCRRLYPSPNVWTSNGEDQHPVPRPRKVTGAVRPQPT